MLASADMPGREAFSAATVSARILRKNGRNLEMRAVARMGAVKKAEKNSGLVFGLARISHRVSEPRP